MPKASRGGYGPICYRKMNPQPIRISNGSSPGYNLADDKSYSVPGQMELSEFMDMTEGAEESD